MTKVELCEPALPPVSVSMGMKVTKSGSVIKAASYFSSTVPVIMAEIIRIISQTMRFLANVNMFVFK